MSAKGKQGWQERGRPGGPERAGSMLCVVKGWKRAVGRLGGGWEAGGWSGWYRGLGSEGPRRGGSSSRGRGRAGCRLGGLREGNVLRAPGRGGARGRNYNEQRES